MSLLSHWLRKAMILEPLHEVDLKLEVDEAALHGGAQRVHDGPVGGEVPRHDHGHVLVQVVLTDHPVEHELVGGDLHAPGRGVGLVQEEEPTPHGLALAVEGERVSLQREQLEGSEPGPLTLFGVQEGAGDARHVGGFRRAEPVVDELELEVLGNAPDDAGLADPRAALDVGDQAGLDALDGELAGLTGGALEEVAHERSGSWRLKGWMDTAKKIKGPPDVPGGPLSFCY
jgi:hypothetical protein